MLNTLFDEAGDAKGWRGTSASLAEFVGRFIGFREPSERVVQGDFHRFNGAKTIRTSGHYSDLIVQPLDGSAGDLPFGAKAV